MGLGTEVSSSPLTFDVALHDPGRAEETVLHSRPEQAGDHPAAHVGKDVEGDDALIIAIGAHDDVSPTLSERPASPRIDVKPQRFGVVSVADHEVITSADDSVTVAKKYEAPVVVVLNEPGFGNCREEVGISRCVEDGPPDGARRSVDSLPARTAEEARLTNDASSLMNNNPTSFEERSFVFFKLIDAGEPRLTEGDIG